MAASEPKDSAGARERVYRVQIGTRLVRVEGAAKFYENVYEEVTREQFLRYAHGDPAWRDSGTPTSTLLERFQAWWAA